MLAITVSLSFKFDFKRWFSLLRVWTWSVRDWISFLYWLSSNYTMQLQSNLLQEKTRVIGSYSFTISYSLHFMEVWIQCKNDRKWWLLIWSTSRVVHFEILKFLPRIGKLWRITTHLKITNVCWKTSISSHRRIAFLHWIHTFK